MPAVLLISFSNHTVERNVKLRNRIERYIRLNKSFPNRRTIENSDLCADTHEKLQFLGKVGYKQAKNNISGLEIIAP